MGWVHVVLICYLVVIPTTVVLMILQIRRHRQAVRRWADENGYAVIRIVYRLSTPGLMVALLSGFVLALLVQLGAWEATIQDEEGGQRIASFSFGHWLVDLPWGKMHVSWQ